MAKLLGHSPESAGMLRKFREKVHCREISECPSEMDEVPVETFDNNQFILDGA